MEIRVAGESFIIQHIQTGEELFQILVKEKPKYFTYDTETTGLHVKADKPFKGAICFKNQVYLFDTTYDILSWFPRWAEEVGCVIGHNICFDLNMNCNIIGEDWLKSKKVKYLDTMNLVQLVVETKSERRGGISLKLKQLGKEYIDPNANQWEMSLKKELAQQNAARKRVLTAYLKGEGYTKKYYEECKKKGEMPLELKEIEEAWLEDYPEPTYNDVPPEILDPYLAVDVILTLLLAKKTLSLVKERKQEQALKIESGIIPIVVRVARVGMEVDFDYLEKSKARLEEEIKRNYEILWKDTDLHGFHFSSGQHATIKKYYEEVKGIKLESSDSDHLKVVGDEEALAIIKLRTLEKWLSTYITKIQHDASFDGRFYSLLNPFKAVSGRFSGDCQQFPKFPLKDDNKEELFFPRRAFKGKWAFADFSQQELRVATHYAIQLGTEDFNLFRAYMPYKCHHYETKEIYDKQIHDWQEVQPNGDSAWITETGESWNQTDLHGATAIQTIGLLGLNITKKENPDDFKIWRQRAKTTNFGKLYGATYKALVEQLGVSEEVARALDDGYYKAFPSLKTYAQMIEKAMRKRGYVENLYGRRYYMTDPSAFYRAGNFIIQGSCAYDVKAKMIRIQDYLDSVGAETQMVITIHDEICYTKIPGEENILAECVKIMEDSSNLLVPLVSEVEKTDTYWSDKK